MRTPEPRRPLSSIELLFDPATEAAIRAEWDALAASGMSSLASHTAASNRPHVTLLARIDLPELDPLGFADWQSFPVVLSAPVLFGSGDRRVLARSIVPTTRLLGIHAAVHGSAGTGDDAPHTAPHEWSPHVTLARRLRTSDLASALEHVQGDIRGRVASLRRWDAVSATTTTIHNFAETD